MVDIGAELLTQCERAVRAGRTAARASGAHGTEAYGRLAIAVLPAGAGPGGRAVRLALWYDTDGWTRKVGGGG
ncbi:hypothetical protein GCM10020221_03670 [Streptomyces thioluteus]|uniref:Uncharacterized protein n=1 Tax=Streptomyces thioluteus TaxID=66431 RepID=A0ABN3WDQ3_STRTU